MLCSPPPPRQRPDFGVTSRTQILCGHLSLRLDRVLSTWEGDTGDEAGVELGESAPHPPPGPSGISLNPLLPFSPHLRVGEPWGSETSSPHRAFCHRQLKLALE